MTSGEAGARVGAGAADGQEERGERGGGKGGEGVQLMSRGWKKGGEIGREKTGPVGGGGAGGKTVRERRGKEATLKKLNEEGWEDMRKYIYI